MGFIVDDLKQSWEEWKEIKNEVDFIIKDLIKQLRMAEKELLKQDREIERLKQKITNTRSISVKKKVKK